MEWQPIETAPRNGTTIIGWLSSDKGFADTTANLIFDDGQWLWSETLDPVKRPDLIKGWQPYPEPPIILTEGQKEQLREAYKSGFDG